MWGRGILNPSLTLAETLFDSLNIPKKINFIDMPESLVDIYQYYTSANVKKLRSSGVY